MGKKVGNFVLWIEIQGLCIVVIYESTNIQSKELAFNAKGGKKGFIWAIMNQHPPIHHPSDDYYYLVMDEPQLN